MNNLARAARNEPPDSSAKGALAGRTAWLISDGKVGMDVQLKGVALALGVAGVTRHVAPRLPWSALAPWGPPDPRHAFSGPDGDFAPPWPTLALATGRQAIPFVRRLRRLAGGATFPVVIQNPRTGSGVADLVCAPEHDALSGSNVVTTLTAPHGHAPAALEAMRAAPPPAIAVLPAPRAAVLLGGPNGAYRFGRDSLAGLAGPLADLKRLGASFLVTPSRRTPRHAMEIVAAATEGAPRLLWDGSGENPYPQFLAQADVLIVTADSVNMAGEACATGRPVFVFEPGRGSAKFRRFHDALRRYGATRPLPPSFDRLDSWRYAPLDSAAVIAREIERRWLARAG